MASQQSNFHHRTCMPIQTGVSNTSVCSYIWHMFCTDHDTECYFVAFYIPILVINRVCVIRGHCDKVCIVLNPLTLQLECAIKGEK